MNLNADGIGETIVTFDPSYLFCLYKAFSPMTHGNESFNMIFKRG